MCPKFLQLYEAFLEVDDTLVELQQASRSKQPEL